MFLTSINYERDKFEKAYMYIFARLMITTIIISREVPPHAEEWRNHDYVLSTKREN